MSLLAELEVKDGATHYKKRVGRGKGSGLGKTSGKGHKGQLARTGGKVRRGFEGGQSPLFRRSPKFGFKNPNPTHYVIVNLKDLAKYGTEITPELLMEKSVMKSGQRLKILADGELTAAVKVKAHKFSAKAKEAIEKAGGSLEQI